MITNSQSTIRPGRHLPLPLYSLVFLSVRFAYCGGAGIISRFLLSLCSQSRIFETIRFGGLRKATSQTVRGKPVTCRVKHSHRDGPERRAFYGRGGVVAGRLIQVRLLSGMVPDSCRPTAHAHPFKVTL